MKQTNRHVKDKQKTNPPVSLEGLTRWRQWCKESCWNSQRTCEDCSPAVRHAGIPCKMHKYHIMARIFKLLWSRPTKTQNLEIVTGWMQHSCNSCNISFRLCCN